MAPKLTAKSQKSDDWYQSLMRMSNYVLDNAKVS